MTISELIKFFCLILLFASCTGTRQIEFPQRNSSVTGSGFYRQATAMRWQARDSFAVKEILAGNVPSFLRKFVPVNVSITDSLSGKKITATYFVSPDYLSLGTDDDWARIPMTPKAAQRIADSLDCFLPTRKMVDDIYLQSSVKLEPVPLFAFRDSTPTMWHHHLIVEGQRARRKGLIAGIKKDVVISSKVSRDQRSEREAIYGWHKSDGKPIQPLYTGHIYWWVDYSHGIRLISRKIRVNGKWMDYTSIMNDEVLRRLLCDEEYCDFLRYDL